MTVIEDAEERQLKDYVANMFPVYRAAILRTPDEQLRDRGFDEAMEQAQRRLMQILGMDDC